MNNIVLELENVYNKTLIKTFLFGVIVGIIYIYIYFGFKIIEKSNLNYHLNFIIHWHHWLISLIIIIIIYLFIKLDKYVSFIYGFLYTLLFHGLMYNDRFDFKIY
tara:strand:+ start:466 stop:780 length:315 start_codon:yes stop_codon:yes gene_type:complete